MRPVVCEKRGKQEDERERALFLGRSKNAKKGARNCRNVSFREGDQVPVMSNSFVKLHQMQKQSAKAQYRSRLP